MNDMTPIEAGQPVGAPEIEAQQDAAQKAKRKKMFIGLGAAVAMSAGGYWGYNTFLAAAVVETNNAYVGADIAQVTPLVGGPVREIRVQDAQAVKRGDILVRLDDTDARLAVARAEAELASAERRVRSLVASDGERKAMVSARVADEARAAAQIAAARADYDRAAIDLNRRQALTATGAVSDEELTTARNAFNTASANVAAARATREQAVANRAAAIGSRNSNQALISDGRVDTNPEVLAARAALAQARVDLDRTVIRAAVDGVVSRRQAQVGQRVQPGAMLMVIVPIQSAYVDANFKEGQLHEVRPGQPVRLTSDLYGDEVVYKGRVVGFSGGTGSAFALVPAQNATGNWIKVVQRLPVRITLDPKQLAKHPLRVGLSMTAEIDISTAR